MKVSAAASVAAVVVSPATLKAVAAIMVGMFISDDIIRESGV